MQSITQAPRAVAPVVAVLLAIATAAQAEPIVIKVGEGPGTLRIHTISPLGAIDGDDGAFTIGTDTANTIWNNCFLIHDGTNAYWSDLGFSTHFEKPVPGPLEIEGNAIRDKGITFGQTKDLKADLAVTLTRPAPDQARSTWKWAFTNSGKTPLNLHMIWFLDMDNELAGTKSTDDATGLVGKLEKYQIKNPIGAIALGNFTTAGAIDLRTGIVMDTDRTPAGLFAVSNTAGSSYYWTDAKDYAATGPLISGGAIPPSINWTADNDKNKDGFADAGGDVGGSMQVNLAIAPGTTEAVSFIATWGMPEVAKPGTFKAPEGAAKAGS